MKTVTERLALILRTRHVWRWHIVNTARRQSVAEHAYLVWAIGMALYDVAVKAHNSLDRRDFSDYLLLHDADEAVLGDIPTPVKMAFEKAHPGIVDRVKMSFSAELHGGFQPTHYLYYLYKMADCCEGLMFCQDNGAPIEVCQSMAEGLSRAFNNGRELFPGDSMVDWEEAMALCDVILKNRRRHDDGRSRL